MILSGARVASSAVESRTGDLRIEKGRIAVRSASTRTPAVDVSGYLILPGLINAHDHLDFDLFPRLGRGPYHSAEEWAKDIHEVCRQQIREVLDVAAATRLLWGGIRNLVSGVTSVCHHNPWNRIFGARFPVRVIRACSWGHSLAFDRALVERQRACPPTQPFIFHAGEAVNSAGQREMDTLAELGLFAPNSVMVHAVALNGPSLRLARQKVCSVVWCPTSNLFVLGATLSREVLESGLPIALGTDSALTCEGDMLDELRAARRVSGLSPERLYRMVTDIAAEVLRLDGGEGHIAPGGLADLVLFRDRGLSPAETLFEQTPEAVFIGGCLQLASGDFAARFVRRFPELARFHRLSIGGRGSMLVRCRAPQLPKGLRLAGREVTV